MKKFLYLLLVLSAAGSGACSSDDDPSAGADNGEPVPPTPSTTVWGVGDFYSVGNVRGVVYCVDDSGEHGRILSLPEWEAQWQTDLGFADPSSGGAGFGNDAGTGLSNWMIVTGTAAWEVNFPAFACCNTLNGSMVIGWHLPAVGDLEEICEAFNGGLSGEVNTERRTLFNKTLTDNGGEPLSGSVYWSSSEMGPQHAYGFDFGSPRSKEPEAFGKLETHKVRAIKNF